MCIRDRGKPAGTQPSKDRDALGRLLKLQALALKQHLVDGLRAVKQPPRAGKADVYKRQTLISLPLRNAGKPGVCTSS